ncbi:MAG TPA: hypothetical protein VGX48_05800 [Pyrinomonadaceae bacterium]|jgi:hypothetical protein|nr:hypothetical protein [Pyrinomonadaceae bacterium]
MTKRDSLFDGYRKPDGKLDLSAVAKYMLNMPGGIESFIVSRWAEIGKIKEQDAALFGELVEELFSIVLRAAYAEDGLAPLQLKAIEKIAHPAKYELTITDIEGLAATDKARPAIARAMELRGIMSRLAWVIAPAKGEKFEPNQPIKLKSGEPPSHLKETYELAEKYWRRGTTLQALAIRVYLAQLQNEGVLGEDEKGINEGSLKDDLAEAKRWEAAHLNVPHQQGFSHGETPIRVFEYSQRWKQMKAKRNERKKGSKKSKKSGQGKKSEILG